MNYDDIPEWIKTASQELENGHLEKLNFLKGSYIGQTMTNASLQEKIEELEEQLDLARAYERERIARYLEATGWHDIAGRVRNEEHYAGGLQ